MNKKLYELMDWAEIEAITYTEADRPKELLGAHSIKKNQTLIEAYYPDAESMSINIDDTKYVDMDMADEAGFFAILAKKDYPFSYTLKAKLTDGEEIEYIDPYSFGQIITDKELKAFNSGDDYNAYKILGAHILDIGGVKGCHFAIWAPNAARVSVVGDFNNWDGRFHQMNKLKESGVFEIFIPGVEAGSLYKFEIRQKGGVIDLRPDPYAFASQGAPDNASIVIDTDSYEWNDAAYLKSRKKKNFSEEPVLVYEFIPSHFQGQKADGSEYNIKELCPKVLEHIKYMGYTHIQLMPICEYTDNDSLGYNINGFYALSSRYGTLDDYKYFIDEMHKNDIGVFFDMPIDHFSNDSKFLKCLDGTCLYEHEDERLGFNPKYGTCLFNFARNEVRSFLYSNVIYMIKEFHLDGIKISSLAAMLYLDYDKSEGQYVLNIYGGKENLEAIEFIKNMNTLVKKYSKDVLTICYDDSAWPNVTTAVKDGGLGFDFKWNNGFSNDYLGYLQYDPLYRTHHYGEICFPIVYSFTEKFILNLSHDEFAYSNNSFISGLPGNLEEKFANYRAAMGYFMLHPGKKLLFMGQDIAEIENFEYNRAINWNLLNDDSHKQIRDYMKDLFELYKKEDSLYSTDSDEKGFEWINCVSAEENIIVFMRKNKSNNKTLVAVFNFENIPRNNYKIGVPAPGNLKEIFNSDSEKYGGFGFENTKTKLSKGEECDGFDDSVKIKIPPLAMVVFEFVPLED